MEDVKVEIGGNARKLEPYNGRKAIMAGLILKRLGSRIPDVVQVMGDFARQWRQDNPIRLTPDMSEDPKWGMLVRSVSEEQWSERGGVILLPPDVPEELQFAQVFPTLMDIADGEVTDLLALVVISNADLKEAVRENRSKEALEEVKNDLLDDARLGELVGVAEAAWDLLREEFSGRLEALSRLRDALREATGPVTPKAEEPETVEATAREVEPEPSEETTTEPTTPTSEPPTSSTSSPPPTDGARSESSTTLVGAPSGDSGPE